MTPKLTQAELGLLVQVSTTEDPEAPLDVDGLATLLTAAVDAVLLNWDGGTCLVQPGDSPATDEYAHLLRLLKLYPFQLLSAAVSATALETLDRLSIDVLPAGGELAVMFPIHYLLTPYCETVLNWISESATSKELQDQQWISDVAWLAATDSGSIRYLLAVALSLQASMADGQARVRLVDSP